MDAEGRERERPRASTGYRLIKGGARVGFRDLAPRRGGGFCLASGRKKTSRRGEVAAASAGGSRSGRGRGDRRGSFDSFVN